MLLYITQYIITVNHNKNYNYAYSKVDFFIIPNSINIPVCILYSYLYLYVITYDKIYNHSIL